MQLRERSPCFLWNLGGKKKRWTLNCRRTGTSGCRGAHGGDLLWRRACKIACREKGNETESRIERERISDICDVFNPPVCAQA